MRWVVAAFVLAIVAVIDHEFRWSKDLFFLCLYGSAASLGWGIADMESAPLEKNSEDADD